MKLGLSFAMLIVAGQMAGFALAYRQWYRHMIQTMEHQTEHETTLIRQALEHQMLTRDDKLIREMVSGFAGSNTVERVMILDREGKVRFSSDPEVTEQHFDRSEPTCQICHQHGPEDRGRNVVLTIGGGKVLRAVQPIENVRACQGCHEPDHRINGLIVADVQLDRELGSMRRSASVLALGSSAIALMLLGGTGWVVRRLVLRRLRRFENAARGIAEGDRSRRVPVEGDDALAHVEQEFNRMADSTTGLLTMIEQKHAQLERVINSVDDGIVVLDRDRVIVAANEAFRRRFPGKDALVGSSCCHGQDTGCGTEGACPTEECFTLGMVQNSMRSRLLADGSTRLEEVRASPVFSPAGELTHVVELWRDVTDRRSAEARLAEYQRLVSVGMLAAGFSHEVNTPLSSIGTCLDGIVRLSGGDLDERTRAQIEDYARIASTQVERCGGITHQFLQLARGRSLPGETVDLLSTIEMAVRLLKHRAADSDVEFEVAPCQEVPSVRANGAAVQQVLLNLMMNAIEASPAGGKVRVRLSRDEDMRVVVSDEGEGIAMEHIPHLFEPFFTRKERGTGLGLFISLGLARGWGGDIRVDSRSRTGSSFTVTFPVDEAGDRKPS